MRREVGVWQRRGTDRKSVTFEQQNWQRQRRSLLNQHGFISRRNLIVAGTQGRRHLMNLIICCLTQNNLNTSKSRFLSDIWDADGKRHIIHDQKIRTYTLQQNSWMISCILCFHWIRHGNIQITSHLKCHTFLCSNHWEPKQMMYRTGMTINRR